jgi:hypothetical protein
MIKARVDGTQTIKDLNNFMNYAIGFLEGADSGKKIFMDKLGESAVNSLKQFIDSNARVSPDTLSHVYEWYRTGSPDSRLFDINYTVSGIGLSFRSTFSQSTSIKLGSRVPFYDKARIMEQGIPVRIVPKKSAPLVFDDDNQTVFTQKPISIANPGGTETTGSFKKVFDLFFENYFSQAFLRSSGIESRLKDTTLFSKNAPAGVRYGKSKGIEAGYRWIANATVN